MTAPRWKVICGDALAELKALPDGCARCCVTSPPYWGLRDYGVSGQLGLEKTPEQYVANMVAVFAEVRRVLADDGTLWLNLGDSYAANRSYQVTDNKHVDVGNNGAARVPDGLKPKDLVGIPWMTAFALRADGWYLRRDIIWSKPNPMPESVTDRPTSAHEYVFLMSKAARYFYDAAAISEPANPGAHITTQKSFGGQAAGANTRPSGNQVPGTAWAWGDTRNARSVWTIATQPYPEAHFATFPPKLAERCILAGSAVGDLVLDPFAGSGTTGAVALNHGRRFVGIELNPAYVTLAEKRIADAAAQGSLFSEPR